MPNLASVLVSTAEQHPDQPALRLDDLTITYAQLRERAMALAGQLRASGLEPGDRVALILPNVPAYPVVFYATILAGGIAVPMNPLLKAQEIDYYFSDSGAKLAFVWPDFMNQATKGAESSGTRVIECSPVGPKDGVLDAAEPLIEVTQRDDEDTAVILYTSGTTGRPKGAELTHANLRSNAHYSSHDVIEIRAGDVVMGCLPLFHVFGLTCGLLASASVGAALTLIPRFEPGKALQVLQRDQVTVMEGVPTMYAAMLHHPDGESTDVSALRTCVSGGSAMPVEVMKSFEEKFRCRVIEGYGLSETSPVASFNMLDRPSKPGTIGRAIPGCEMKLVGDDGADVGPGGGIGEIAIRGENLMKRYWDKPEETAAAIPDGWFRTGDLATVDEDGYYTIVDRKKDMIIRGGMNVYPREIEEVLYQHPAVLEAAVVGVPDAMMGEEVGAAVAFKPGSEATLEDVQQFVKERVAAYKYPRRLWVLDELPKGPTGKILRREVSAPQDGPA